MAEEIQNPSFENVQASTRESNVGLECVMDYTSEFLNFEVFKSRESLVQWTRDVGRKNGFVVVIKGSDLGGRGRNPRIHFACERSGKYRQHPTSSNSKPPKDRRSHWSTGTKKCECPFALKGLYICEDEWMLKVICGVHNHPTAEYMEGHSYAGRLSETELSLMLDMSNSLVRPKAILSTLKNRDPTNVSTMKTIYNVRHRNKVTKAAGRSQMQHLLGMLSEHKYIEWHRNCNDTDAVTDLFWTHPTSVELLRTFHHVLLMDCTYKTNRYRMPLLEIVGVTSTEMTFSIAFAYLQSEREDSYSWALDRLRSVLDETEWPQVIVTDREIALMNAVEHVFPGCKHLLCKWHINKNVLARCKKMFATKQLWENFMAQWKTLHLSDSEDKYARNLRLLQEDFKGHAPALEYVMTTWLLPYRDRFVAAWTDHCMHFGNTTTNRAESAHAKLKRQLGTSQGSFQSSWEKIHSLIELQHTEIKASFEKSLNVVQHNFRPALFKDLRGFISLHALHMVLGEADRAQSIGVDQISCGCVIRRTHGLPCAHSIAEYQLEGRPIPLSSIHAHWKKLCMVPPKKSENVLSCEPEMEMIRNRFNGMDESSKLQFLKKMKELGNPETTPLLEPEVLIRTRGRPSKKGADTSTRRMPSAFELIESGGDSHSPAGIVASGALTIVPPPRKKAAKKTTKPTKLPVRRNTGSSSGASEMSRYVDQFPFGMRPHISHYINVLPDGNCGFRALAALLGYGEEGWIHVRRDMLDELFSFPEFYGRLYGSEDRYNELARALSYFQTPAPFDFWMVMPEMGFLVSSRYNVVLFFFSAALSITCLPFRSRPVPLEFRKEISIGFVDGNHFLQLFLVPGHPIPPIATHWEAFREERAVGWRDNYIARIQRYKEVNNFGTDTTIPVHLDSD